MASVHFLLLTAALTAAALLLPPPVVRGEEVCAECVPENCPQLPDSCPAGMVKDRCGCCPVCGQKEGQLCDLPTKSPVKPSKHGLCGDDLECRIRPDTNPMERKDEPQYICYCKFIETLCGTDGQTYSNLCKMMERAYEAKANSSVQEVKVDHRGPCASAPWIETAPESVDSKVGDNVVLTCEIMGYPIPQVEWTYTGIDGRNIMLPSDMDHIAVQARGGPEQYEITSWLQVQGLTPSDEGEYVCTGKNELGSVESAARVIVIDKEKYMDNKEFRVYVPSSNDI